MRGSRAWTRSAVVPLLALTALAAGTPELQVELDLRGRPQRLHVYGPPDGPPIVVVSGDGGWMHLGPEVAEELGRRGWRVVGIDAKHYLAAFTSGQHALSPQDVTRDFATFVDYALAGRDERIALIGVSEGAGLAVLAASDPGLQPRLAGVLGLGLPDVNELGWHWKDAIIYLTHGVPREPTFRSRDYVPLLGPVPLALIHSTHDEFAPLPDARALAGLPGGPKRLWVIDAENHRFSGRIDELHRDVREALAWMKGER